MGVGPHRGRTAHRREQTERRGALSWRLRRRQPAAHRLLPRQLMGLAGLRSRVTSLVAAPPRTPPLRYPGVGERADRGAAACRRVRWLYLGRSPWSHLRRRRNALTAPPRVLTRMGPAAWMAARSSQWDRMPPMCRCLQGGAARRDGRRRHRLRRDEYVLELRLRELELRRSHGRYRPHTRHRPRAKRSGGAPQVTARPSPPPTPAASGALCAAQLAQTLLISTGIDAALRPGPTRHKGLHLFHQPLDFLHHFVGHLPGATVALKA